jgi:hypothetical protein
MENWTADGMCCDPTCAMPECSLNVGGEPTKFSLMNSVCSRLMG